MLAFIKEQLNQAGKFSLYTVRFYREDFVPPFHYSEFIRQCYTLGYKSLPLVSITGLIIWLVLTIQSRNTTTKFGAESWLPSMVSLSLIGDCACDYSFNLRRKNRFWHWCQYYPIKPLELNVFVTATVSFTANK